MSQPAIRAVGLTKRFGSVQALRALDLQVQPGEVFGYLGPNGAGKTTTIRLLLDFIRPTRGHIQVLGASGADPEVRRRIGYLPAELPVDPRWTAQDLLDFYGRLRGGVNASWVGELLGRFDLDPTRRVGELSTGNRRKVGIVQAVIHRPELLVLDEPSSNLDPASRRELADIVRSLDVTILMVTHDLPYALQLCPRSVVLDGGVVVADGPTRELLADAELLAAHRLELPFGFSLD